MPDGPILQWAHPPTNLQGSARETCLNHFYFFTKLSWVICAICHPAKHAVHPHSFLWGGAVQIGGSLNNDPLPRRGAWARRAPVHLHLSSLLRRLEVLLSGSAWPWTKRLAGSSSDKAKVAQLLRPLRKAWLRNIRLPSSGWKNETGRNWLNSETFKVSSSGIWIPLNTEARPEERLASVFMSCAKELFFSLKPVRRWKFVYRWVPKSLMRTIWVIYWLIPSLWKSHEEFLC